MGLFDIFGKKQSIDDNGKFKANLSKKDKLPELDEIISQIRMNLGNNYKDEAQRELKKLVENFGRMQAEGKLNERQLSVYGEEVKVLSARLDGFSHKDQKPYWC